jgi:CRISPR-associated protein Cas1
MKRVYIVGKGKLIIKERGLVLEKYEKNVKKQWKLPINNIDLILCEGLIGLSPLSLRAIINKNITVLFLGKNGALKGVLLPISKAFPSLQIFQCKAFLDKRLEIATEFINSLKISSILSLSMIRDKISKEISEKIKSIEISPRDSIEELMGLESIIWKNIYEYLRLSTYDFEKREFHPPKGRLNSIISFGNSMLYSLIFSKIVEEDLNPKIGFLHEAYEGRNSLALDISESFKPPLLLLLNLYIIRNNILNEIHFNENENSTFLNDLGRSIYIKMFEKFISTKMFKIHKKGKFSLSSLIEIEVKNLGKSIVNNKRFFSVWRTCSSY